MDRCTSQCAARRKGSLNSSNGNLKEKHMPNDPITQRYKFVVGKGDTSHEQLLNKAADDEGFRATMMVFDPSGSAKNTQVIVLMEKET
jgi:hypothetical protein